MREDIAVKTFFSLGAIDTTELAKLCNGTAILSSDSPRSVRAICTDSREADANTVFCAIRGERVDGHQYIDTVVAIGCPVILCERMTGDTKSTAADVILVQDTVAALAAIAKAYGQGLACKKVAVTGSVGKTTTKDMINAVLSAKHQAFKTKGNFNSIIGMPLSMLEITKDADYAVLEMGMSGFGEIERLSVTAEPEIAVITTIGTSHMEMLGSRENICRAKLEILCGLKKGGVLLLNGDEPLLSKVYGKSYTTVYVSTERENADFYAKNIRVMTDCTLFDIVYQGKCEPDLCVRVVGRHNVYSALFAFAIGMLAGLQPDEIRRGLLQFAPEKMRQNIITVGNITIMEDCYNASPESMQAAIDVLSSYTKLTGGRSIAVLGDMLELGEESSALHRQVGAHLVKREIDCLFTVGKESKYISVGARQRGMYRSAITDFGGASIEEIGARLLAFLQSGDVVLFKASRALAIENIIEYIKQHLC